ncbi:hypothetical protein B9Z55_006296 [Caenorhabditis nigoni]|uniref:PAN-3 domain-containing protein n=1 Tax=Caenorhabditis nigoni TaxID=1611254 RepID=A0A2G5V4K2_9PELO|nr:hypothetical protein B9Z55_006296 [Caenorhabditis nigoni]
MFFQWGFFFFLLNILHSNAANQKMMLVFGKVANIDLSKGTVKSEKNCINDCYKQAKCFVAYMNSNGNCLSFDFDYTKNLTVIETTRSEGLKVAFKINFNLTDCPSYEQLETIVGENDESILWNRTYNGWTFNRCIDDWKVFPRIDSSAVCMQTFNLSEGVSKAKSIEFCEQKGFKLTGVASVAESQWIVGRIITNGANYRGYWIDGERKNRVFGWTDGYTTPLLGNSALVVSNAELSITNLA